jgi:hypothetical protein
LDPGLDGAPAGGTDGVLAGGVDEMSVTAMNFPLVRIGRAARQKNSDEASLMRIAAC